MLCMLTYLADKPIVITSNSQLRSFIILHRSHIWGRLEVRAPHFGNQCHIIGVGGFMVSWAKSVGMCGVCERK